MMSYDSPTATIVDTPLNFISMDGVLPSSKPVPEQCSAWLQLQQKQRTQRVSQLAHLNTQLRAPD